MAKIAPDCCKNYFSNLKFFFKSPEKWFKFGKRRTDGEQFSLSKEVNYQIFGNTSVNYQLFLPNCRKKFVNCRDRLFVLVYE